MNKDHNSPRDPRGDAPVIGMNLFRSTEEINYDLKQKYPDHPYLWWELETDEKTGWVYSSSSHILAKLVHNGGYWGVLDHANNAWLERGLTESDAKHTAKRWNLNYKTEYYVARELPPAAAAPQVAVRFQAAYSKAGAALAEHLREGDTLGTFAMVHIIEEANYTLRRCGLKFEHAGVDGWRVQTITSDTK